MALGESFQRAVAALFGTALLVVITLTTLKINDIDAALLSAVHFFVWSAALLGAYLILGAAASLPFLERPLLRRLFGHVLMALGTLTWLRGAYYVLLHYHVSGIEIVFMQTLIVTSLVLATSDVRESLDGAQKTLVDAQKTLDSLKEVERALGERKKTQKDQDEVGSKPTSTK